MLLLFASYETAFCQVIYSHQIDPYPVKIVLPVTIARESHPFILSTATYRVHVDISLGRLLGNPQPSEKTANPQDGARAEVFEGVPLSLGDWSFTPQKIRTADLADFNANSLGNAKGVLGSEVLQGRTLSLNFDDRKLQILRTFEGAPPDWQRAGMGESELGIASAIQVELHGELLQFSLDTGVDGTIGLSHATFEKFKGAGLIVDSDMRGTEGTVGRPGKESRWGRFTKGEILGMNLEGMSVTENDNSNVLGLAFLVNYNLLFDLKEGTLYYHRRNCEPPIFADAMLGMGLVRQDGKLVVTSVAPESAASEAGIKIGDQILRLGKLEADSIDEAAKYQLCLQNAGQEIQVQILRGGQEPRALRLRFPPKIFQFPAEPDSNKQ